MTAVCPWCLGEFVPKRESHVYCCHACSVRHYKSQGRTEESRKLLRLDGERAYVRRLHCHYCRGKHMSDRCPNRGNDCVRQFGTVKNGEYVPPPGVKVRVLRIPSTVHGDDLTRILKED